MTATEPARASTEDWCERYPGEGHSWTYTSHAGLPRVETRKCGLCGYLSVQPVREQIAQLAAENARLRQQRDEAREQLRQRDSALAKAVETARERTALRQERDEARRALYAVKAELEEPPTLAQWTQVRFPGDETAWKAVEFQAGDGHRSVRFVPVVTAEKQAESGPESEPVPQWERDLIERNRERDAALAERDAALTELGLLRSGLQIETACYWPVTYTQSQQRDRLRRLLDQPTGGTDAA